MPKRSSSPAMRKAPREPRKPPVDENQAAFDAVAQLTGGGPPEDGKNPAAVYLGRLGGKKGGPARAKALSKKRRVEIARKAARKRWKER